MSSCLEGGDSLILHVTRNSRIPIIKNDRGMCHVYVHEDADLSMARKIVVNAKAQRPGVCNAMETLLVHESVSTKILPALCTDLESHGVKWFGCARTLAILKNHTNVVPVGEKSFDTEYLDFKMNCRVVDSLDQALLHIAQHGSGHSEAIVTKSEKVARSFQSGVDASCHLLERIRPDLRMASNWDWGESSASVLRNCTYADPWGCAS